MGYSYSWNRLHVGHTKEALRRRGTELPWKQTALPRSRWWWLGYQGLGVVMAGSTDDYLSRVSVLKQQLLCLRNKTGGSGLCYIVNAQHAQLHGLVEKFS